MFNSSCATLDAVIEAVYAKKGKLTPAHLTELMDRYTSNLDLLKALCAYINAFKGAKNPADVREMAQLELQVKELREQYKMLQIQCNTQIKDTLESQKRELAQTAKILQMERDLLMLSQTTERLRNLLLTYGCSVEPLPTVPSLPPQSMEVKENAGS